MAKLDIQSNEQHIQIGRWNLSYLFFPCEESKRLIVCVGGRNYGYTGNIYEQQIGISNLLYLKDNAGPDGSRLWWLAYDGDFSVGKAYAELIKKQAQECDVNIEDICYVGNCVGGFGGLYLSYMIGAGKVVAIAPYIAVGSAYENTPLLERIVGNPGIDLDDYIFDFFNCHSEVEAHIFIANEDTMMKRSQLSRFIDIMIKQKNLFVIKNFKITHPKETKVHSAIAYSIFSKEILNEFDQSLNRFYKYSPSKKTTSPGEEE